MLRNLPYPKDGLASSHQLQTGGKFLTFLKIKMGQQEVYNVIKEEKGRWLTAREIADKLNRPFGRVVVNLSRLRRSDTVLCRQAYRIVKPAGKRAVLIYKYK